jgi:hypothetical protein
MSTNHSFPNELAFAETPQAEPGVTPEEMVQQLRAWRRQAEFAPLTPEQRKQLRDRIRLPDNVVLESINAIGAHGRVEKGVGVPAEDVLQLVDKGNRWKAVEAELRTALNGIAGANLLRRYRLEVIATRACSITAQLVRDPDNAILIPHVEEIKRLRSIARRRKRQQASEPQPPESETAAPEAAVAPDTTTPRKS